jgi:hypothetical protein
VAEWGFILLKQNKRYIMGIPDKNINGIDWSSVNVLSGLPIGTPMAIQLKTNAMILLFDIYGRILDVSLQDLLSVKLF